MYHELWRRGIEIPCNIPVLTTYLIPAEDNQNISKMLKVSLDEFGFLLEAHLKLRPVEFAMDGIYICGSARRPTDAIEGVSQAYAAASKAAGPLRMGYVRAEAHALVDEDEYSGCGILCSFRLLSFSLEMGRGYLMSMKRYARAMAPVVLPVLQELFPCTILPMSKS